MSNVMGQKFCSSDAEIVVWAAYFSLFRHKDFGRYPQDRFVLLIENLDQLLTVHEVDSYQTMQADCS